MNSLSHQGKVSAANMPKEAPQSRRAGLQQILNKLEKSTGERFSSYYDQIDVAHAEWDRPNNTIRLYVCEDYATASEEELDSLQRLGHWIYDTNLTYTEIWTFANDEPPRRIWTIRDEIIERSLRLTTDSEGRLCLEQEIHAVGVHAQSAVDWALHEAQSERVASKRSSKPRDGTVRLSLVLERATKQAIRLLAAAKDATDSAIVNEAISLYLTALTCGAKAPLRGGRSETVPTQCGSRRSSYIIDSINREAMELLKSSKSYSFSDVARMAISYRISLEDSGDSLREISAELVQSQSDCRDKRASDLLSYEVTKKLSGVVRSIAFASPLSSETGA